MITTVFTDLQTRFGISDEVVQLLSDSGVEPAKVEHLLGAGISGDDIVIYILDYGAERGIGLLELNHRLGYKVSDELLGIFYDYSIEPTIIERLMAAGMSPDDIILLMLDYGVTGLKTITNLVNHKIQPIIAADVVRLATNLLIFDEVYLLIKSEKLRNLPSLRKFLREVESEVSQGNYGKVRELQDAANRAAQGHDVQLGKIGNYGADVLDHTTGEAIQHKLITTKDQLLTEQHISKAADQLAGLYGEVPPPGYTRMIDIEVTNPQNPLFDADRGVISLSIQEVLLYKSAVDRVRFTNHRGPYIFEAPDFS